MSGRSAYVRKVKVDKNNKAGYDYLNKDDTFKGKEHTPSIKSDPSIPESSRVGQVVTSTLADHSDFSKLDEISAARSVYNAHYETEYSNPGYARIRRPEMPIIETSGIERSAFRSKMEKSSENFRHNFANVFKKKKGGKEELHGPPAVKPIGEDKYELSAEEMHPHSAKQLAFRRAANFKGEITSETAKLKLWRRKDQPIVLWDKFDARDPDLWDLKGDVLIFYAKEAGDSQIPQPAFRLNSQMIESLGSPLIDALLRGGITDEVETRSIAESYRNDFYRPQNPSPPGSDTSKSFESSQISYKFTLPAAGDISGTELLRYKLSWRNVFSACIGKGLVGYSLHQAIIDLIERYSVIMPRYQNLTYFAVNHTIEMGRHDLRDDPESACSMLIWSEHKKVHWQQGWHEAFVHCAGMYNQVSLLPSWKNISPTTKLMLDKASVDTSTRVAYCEDFLASFNYGSFWPENSSFNNVSSRDAFVRLQGFFCSYYTELFEIWPPVPPANSKNIDGWLTRLIVRILAADFYALYDYLVDRQVIWSGSAEMNSRRTILVRPGSPHFCPNTHDCEFTSLIERFDNNHKFPSIPHPYPRLPDSIPPPQYGRFTQLEARKSALSYTEATNIFILGDDYESNDLVEHYIQWEKTDKIGECDPRSARRARWVLIYFVLQTLSTLALDTPALAHSEGVEYFLFARIDKQPIWIEDQSLKQEVQHDRTHCWTVSSTWKTSRRVENTGLESTATGMFLSHMSSSESVAKTSTLSEAETANDLDNALPSSAAAVSDSDASFLTMQPNDHLRIRTQELYLKPAQSPAPKPVPSQLPKSAPPLPKLSTSPVPNAVSLFPAPPRQPIEQYNSAKPIERFYTAADHLPSLPPKSPLPETPSSYGSAPRHFPNPNRNMTAYQSPRTRPSPIQLSSFTAPPPPGHEGEVMGLRIRKSASSTPVSSPTISSPYPDTLSEHSASGYAPGIEKIEEHVWPSMRRGNGNGNGNGNVNKNGNGNSSPVAETFRGHQKGRNIQLSGQQLFHIRDYDEHS